MDELTQIADELAEICRQIDVMREKHLHIVPGHAPRIRQYILLKNIFFSSLQDITSQEI